MITWARFALVASFLAAPVCSFSDESELAPSAPVSGVELSIPNDVGNFGAFSYEVPIEIPEFRGLQPDLSLKYSSQNKERGGWKTIAGLGWTLSGISSIERVSVGRGAPSYDAKQDIFLLDGMELLACDFSGDPGKYDFEYPDKYKTTQSSASCLAGGDMTTLNERYLKIQKVGSDASTTAKFYVTRKDGTRLTYKSVGQILGETTAPTRNLHLQKFQHQWMLTEIRDAQKNRNTVTFEYVIDTYQDRYTPRIKTIRYQGYSVVFDYEQKAGPKVRYATGTSHPGMQPYRLNYIQILNSNGSAKVRAYDLSYELSRDTDADVLSRVQKLGRDFSVVQLSPASGDDNPSFWGLKADTKQPPWTFTYSDDGNFWAKYDLGIEEDPIFSKDRPVKLKLNTTDDAQTAIVRLPIGPNGDISGPEPGRAIAATSDKKFDISTLSLEDYPQTDRNGYSRGSKGNGDLLWTVPVRVGAKKNFFVFKGAIEHRYTTGSGDTFEEHFYSTCFIDLRRAEAKSSKTVLDHVTIGSKSDPCNPRTRYLVGNFDGDNYMEVIVAGSMYRIKDGKFIRATDLDKNLSDYMGKLASEVSYHPQIMEWEMRDQFRPMAGPFVVDIDGDGTDEILGTSKYLTLGKDGLEAKNLPGTHVLKALNGHGCYANPSQCLSLFGDVNGDGLTDYVRVRQSGGKVIAYVSLNLGGKFGNGQLWTKDVELTSNTSRDFKGTALSDVNGDGLADLVAQEVNSPYDQSEADAYILISDGARFKKSSLYREIPKYRGVADLTGNGLLEIFTAHSKGHIFYQTKPAANLLTSVKDPQGGTTSVEYAPSGKLVTGDKLPGVQQLVKSITRDNGFAGQERKTSYRYSDGVYDVDWRRSLGFSTVEATLPAIGGEGSGKTRVTTMYSHSHYGESGLVLKRVRSFYKDDKDPNTTDLSTLRTETFKWKDVSKTKLPFRAIKKEKRVRDVWNNTAFETTTHYGYSPYGNLVWKKEYGFGGTQDGVQPEDDRRTQWEYFEGNTDDYIVDKVRWKITSGGITTADRSKWVSREFYSYDGLKVTEQPTRGNVTRIAKWNGNLDDGWARRTIATFAYDDFGNVTSETDAVGNTTTHKYDVHKNLFRIETQNALGHKAKTVWDHRCQEPLHLIDVNNLKTSYAYDALCRVISETLPNGHEVVTLYEFMGNPTKQRVKTYEAGAGSAAQLKTREYFDGFGQVYRTARSGRSGSLDDFSVVLSRYDTRGNLAWKSIPLPWREGGDVVYAGSSKRTSFSYDPMDRLTRTTFADGNKKEILYHSGTASTTLLGQVNKFPRVVYKDESCFDGNAETLCNNFYREFDAYGRPLKEWRWDHGLVDVDANGVKGRVTKYVHDAAGRLVTLRDPRGAYWRYAYDSFGNRTTSDDPALGVWTMSYDKNGNLKTQQDAEGNTIMFSYDALNRTTLKEVRVSESGTYTTEYKYDQGAAPAYNKGKLTTVRVRKSGQDWHHTRATDYNALGLAETIRDTLNAREFQTTNEYYSNGALKRQWLPAVPGTEQTISMPIHTYDAAQRPIAFGDHVTDTTYDVAGRMKRMYFINGTFLANQYDSKRGWLTAEYFKKPATGANSVDTVLDRTLYVRRADGRVDSQNATRGQGDFNFTYDYAGRLTVADNFGGRDDLDRSYTYDKAGSMRSKSDVGQYKYNPQAHTPYEIVKTDGTVEPLSYDKNGNMETGLNGKVIRYDGENRPVSVEHNGMRTEYVYGADGARLKRIDDAGTALQSETVYIGDVEIRNFGQGTQEVFISYPHPNMRFENGTPVAFLFKDQLGSLRRETDVNADILSVSTYLPFGKQIRSTMDAALGTESDDVGWIGERYDAKAELQYLNARYYDPELGSYIPPDTSPQPHPTIH